ncbi:hypothetical protein DEU56DRAFT_772607 [Suillus clintonianus]|uniref:uncharacterized protein n=1 Tax=Suillus clintonianus TaxID=1904413 RepID=UPI001B877F6F|nr:uncharacterized protein DEU56DRAFT_772607 [Suillus clintonianus]KAG2154053.1 hypothetical protein DEU56DRAFT_772607 [Suillus clintonianus]
MLPIANLNLKDLYQSTFEFFASRSPSFSFSAFSAEDSVSEISFPLTPRDPTPRNFSSDEESASLRDRLDAAEHTDYCHTTSTCNPSFGASAAASTLYSMRREHDATKNELSRTQAEVARWEERYKTLEKTLKETRDLLKVRDQEIQVLKKERERHSPERHRPSSHIDRRRSRDLAHHRSDSSQSQQIRLSADWSEIRDDTLSQANGNHRRNGSDPHPDNMSTVSEEERAQSRSLETFLNKIDLWSGAQVIQAVQDLNSEILQFAASATELCTFSKQRPNSAKVTQASSEVATRLGAALSRLLATRDHSQDPMLVQLALQGCISYCISRALSSFCIGYQSKANITLTQIYTHMFHSEPQPTSSRWRALTHKHIHELHPELNEYAINEMTETIFRWSLDIFLISGSTNPQPNPASRENFRARFGAQVKRISKAACRLAQVTKEEIMSANFEVIAADSGQPFDGQEMLDAFEDYKSSDGVVLCTTELGLRCSTRKATSDAPASDESIDRRILLRPKVVLESIVEVIDPR